MTYQRLVSVSGFNVSCSSLPISHESKFHSKASYPQNLEMPIEWTVSRIVYLLTTGTTEAPFRNTQPGSESDGVTDVCVTAYLFTYEWSNDVRRVETFSGCMTERMELVSNYLAFFYIKQLNE